MMALRLNPLKQASEICSKPFVSVLKEKPLEGTISSSEGYFVNLNDNMKDSSTWCFSAWGARFTITPLLTGRELGATQLHLPREVHSHTMKLLAFSVRRFNQGSRILTISRLDHFR